MMHKHCDPERSRALDPNRPGRNFVLNFGGRSFSSGMIVGF